MTFEGVLRQMNSIQEETKLISKKNKKLSYLSLIINVGVLYCILKLFAIYALIESMGVRYASDKPIFRIVIMMIILIGIGCFLHIKQRSWTTLLMIPILVLTFIVCFFDIKELNDEFNMVSSYYSQNTISGQIILGETPDAIKKFRNLSFLPLICAIAYICTYIKCKIRNKGI